MYAKVVHVRSPDSRTGDPAGYLCGRNRGLLCVCRLYIAAHALHRVARQRQPHDHRDAAVRLVLLL